LFEEYGAVKHIFLPTNWKKTKDLALLLEMSVKAQEEAAKFELNGSKWMAINCKFMKLTLKKTTQNRQANAWEFEF